MLCSYRYTSAYKSRFNSITSYFSVCVHECHLLCLLHITCIIQLESHGLCFSYDITASASCEYVVYGQTSSLFAECNATRLTQESEWVFLCLCTLFIRIYAWQNHGFESVLQHCDRQWVIVQTVGKYRHYHRFSVIYCELTVNG